MATTSWSTCKELRGYSDATVTGVTTDAVATEYPHGTLHGTLTCSSYSSTALYETHIPVRRIWMCKILVTFKTQER